MNIEDLTQETRDAREALIASGADVEAIDAYIELATGDDDLSDFEESYSGEFDSDEAFAQNMAESLGDIPSAGASPWPLYCIDWEYAARELMYDYSESNGFYFRNL